MGRPGYISLYADEKTQRIFDEFTRIKGITKSTALSEMMEIYMISQDEQLYLNLKKKMLGVEVAKQLILQSSDEEPVNDYIFIKLSDSFTSNGEILNAEETMLAYIRNCETNGLDYTWFSTESLYFGMSKKKVDYYNRLCSRGEIVKMLFAIGGGINEICYSATVVGIISSKEPVWCGDLPESVPVEFGEGERARIWIMIKNIKEEHKLKAEMFRFRSNGNYLKQAITSSQFHFGYVYIPDSEE
ncbi:MAG: hypothetical protein J1E83_08365 [Lachnospiraceae bacterium]|nr:hypothetical protein [Lachnospiraceae bacterium]